MSDAKPVRLEIEQSQKAGAPPGVLAIYATLRREITMLQKMPRERLSENELALRFGTSRTPVREALIRLVEEGLIEVWPQRGTFVSRISLRAVKRARFVREALEVAVVRYAAERGLAAEALAQAEEALARQQGAVADPVQFTDADDSFHRALADGVRLGDIWAVVEREKAQFDRVRFLSLPNVTPVATLIAQHRAILDAIHAREPAAAEKAMRQHMTEVLKIADTLAARHPDLIDDDEDEPASGAAK
jgi:DNA-binding GntR family transcriptional regulator